MNTSPSLVFSFSTAAAVAVIALGGCSGTGGDTDLGAAGGSSPTTVGSGATTGAGGGIGSGGGAGTDGSASGGAGTGGGAGSGSGGSGSGGSGSGGSDPGGHCGDAPHVAGGYCVVGSEIVRDSDGGKLTFRGANVPGLEWDANNPTVTQNNFGLLGSWGATIVRVPLNQEYWRLDEDGYRARVASVVSWANAAGLVAILDLHRLDRKEVFDGQRPMANAASVTFWQEVAGAYKDNPDVFFELYNEPSHVSWDEWENGGTPNGYATIGMESLYQAVRGTGAKNIVLVSGIDWAYSLEEVLDRPFADSFNVGYVTHLYNFSNKQPSAWQDDWLFVTSTAPVFITEFGTGGGYAGNTGTSYVSSVLSTGETNESVHWTAWALFPWGGGTKDNAMIGPGWNPAANVFPLTTFGETVRDAM